MIITCQNCQTHYSVNVGAIGGGMSVRCANCGNTWHQNPVQATRPMPQPMPMPMAPAPQPQQPIYAEQTPFQQPAASPPPPPPPPLPEPIPEPEPAPEPEPEPAPEPEPEPAPELEPEAPAEAAGGDEMEAADEFEAAGASEDALSPEQLDEMFGEDTESGAFQSLAETKGSDDDEEPPIDDPDTIPEPEPIPQVLSAEDDGSIDDLDEKKGGKGKIIGIAAAVLIIALGAGVFFGKSFIVGLWPGAVDIYAMVGLGGDELGAGLDIRNVKSSREVDGGVDVLVVRGVVANISEEDRQVPMIRVSLFDGGGEEIQHVVAAPVKSRLPGGATVGFRAQLAEPSPLARRLEVTFSADKKDGG